MDSRSKATTLASEALQDLGRPGASISLSIEKALRIAILLGHTYWHAWCKLQLIENGDTNAIQRFQEQFAVKRQNNGGDKEAIENALCDYVKSRTAPTLGEGKLFGSPLTDLENSFAFFEAGMHESPLSIPREVFAQGEEQRKMLNGIRAKVRDYLIDSESGTAWAGGTLP
jgi:hypothetical protein